MSRGLRNGLMIAGIAVVILITVFVIVYILPWLATLDLSGVSTTTPAQTMATILDRAMQIAYSVTMIALLWLIEFLSLFFG